MGFNTRANSAADRASSAYAAARENQYVQRLLEDEKLRANLRDAFDSARKAYGRVSSNGKHPVNALTSDRKAQRELKEAAEALREASEQIRKPKRKKSRLGRILIFGAVAGGVTLALSESARKAVMDTLFGAEEEFEYTSTTSTNSAPPAPAPTGAASEEQ
ncbi:MAG: hypothetical protein U0R52_06445 [Solirubrobacterales bacterium]